MAGLSLGNISINITTNIGQFTKGLNTANKQLDKFSKGFGKSLQGTKKHLIDFSRFVGQIAHYISFSIGVQMVMQIRRSFDQMIEDFTKFERAATNAATVAGYLGTSFESVRKNIMDVSKALGRETIYSATDVADAFYNLASAGYDVATMTKRDLLPILNYAAATQASLEEATYAVLTALKAFNLEFSDATMVADTFTAAITSSFLNFEKLQDAMRYVAPIAGALNVELSETVATLGLLTDKGYTGAQAGQRLNMIFTKLLSPTEKGRKVLEGMGLAMEDLNPETNTLVEIFQRLRAAGFGAAEASQMFRARTAASAAVIVDNINYISAYNKQLQLSAGISEEVAQKQEQTLFGAFEMMKNVLQEAGLGLAEDLTPAFYKLVDIVRNDLVPALDMIGGVFKTVISNASTLIPILKVLIGFWIVKKSVLLIVNGLLTVYNVLSNLGAESATRLSFAELAVAKATMTHAGAQTALNAALMANPYVLAAVAIGGLIATMFLLKTETKETQYALEDITGISFDNLKTELGSLKTKVGELLLADIEEDSGFFGIKLWSGYTRDAINNLDSLVKSLDFTQSEIKDLSSQMKEFTGIDITREVDEGIIGSKYIIDIYNLADALSSLSDEQRQSILADISEKQAKSELSAEYFDMVFNVNNLTKAFQEESLAQQQLESIDPSNIEEFAKASYNATLATENREKAELDSMKSIKLYLNEVRKFEDVAGNWVDSNGKVIETYNKQSGILDKAIGYLEDYAQIANQIEITEDNLIRANEELDISTQELASSIAEYGRDSNEARRALNAYESNARNVAKLDEDLISLNSKLSQSEKDLQKLRQMGVTQEYTNEEGELVTVTRELTDTELGLLTTSSDLINAREAYIDATTEATLATLDFSAAQEILDNYTKISSEKLKDYFEMQEKVFEIESKLYTLRHDEKKQLEELFGDLAEQGLMTNEIAEAYGNMQEAQGDVTRLNQGYLDIIQDLTPEQKGLVEALINTTIGTDEYYDALQNLQDAGFLSQSELDYIMQYDQALEDLANTTNIFNDAILPATESLVNIGAVSSETADDMYELQDNTAEESQLLYELNQNSLAIIESFSDLTGVTTRLARSLQDESDEVDSISSVFPELLRQMGIFDDLGGSNESIINNLEAIFGRSVSTLGDFTDEELILASTLVQVASGFNLYEQGMTQSQLATALQIGSINTLNTSISEGLSDNKTYYELQNNQTDTAENATKAFNNLTSAMTAYTTALRLSNEALFKNALRFDAVDLITNTFGGNVDELISYMDSQDWQWEPSIVTNWDRETWETFQSGLTGERKETFNQFIKDISGNEVATITKWDGDDWTTFESNLKSDVDRVAEYINTLNPVLTVTTRWEGPMAGMYETSWAGPMAGAFMQRGDIVSTPQTAVIGENGAEAVIPLEGKNKKRGRTLLEQIIPKYFPDLAFMQTGGVVNGGNGADSIVYKLSNSIKEFVYKLSGVSEEMKNNLINGGYNIETAINILKTTLSTSGENLKKDIDTSVKTFSVAMGDVIDIQNKSLLDVVKEVGTVVQSWTKDGITRNVTTPKNIKYAPGTNINRAKKDKDYAEKHGLMKYFEGAKGGIVSKATFGMFGEKGAEALIPLEGINKKYGEQLLKTIIPQYYPDLMHQTGGLFGTTRNVNYGSSTTNNDNFNIMGPVYVTPKDVDEFSQSMKYKFRASH